MTDLNFYVIVAPLIVYFVVLISFWHTHRVRLKPTGFDPAIYIVLYILCLMALAPYLLLLSGGI